MKDKFTKKDIFEKYFKSPLIVGIVAVVIYIIDNFLGDALVKGGSFMWVAFVSWTVFASVSLKDRFKAVIGMAIGFGFGVLMWWSSTFFAGSVAGISIAGLLFVFLANGAMMFFPHLKKIWLDSLSGIFVGVAMTFSGVGVGLSPNTAHNAFLLLGIILIYGIFGLVAGFAVSQLSAPRKKKFSNSDEIISHVCKTDI